MNEYEFTLIVPDMDEDTVNSIYGLCPDSSIGRSHGTMYVAFDREAASLDEAIYSAIADLRRSGVEPVRIEMDVPDPVA